MALNQNRTPTSGMSLAAYLRDVYKPLALAHLAPAWRVNSERELELLAVSSLGSRPLRELTPAIIAGWWGWQVSRKFPSAANKQRQWLRQSLRHAVTLELLDKLPAFPKRVRENPERVRWLSEEQRKAILEEARRTNPRVLRYIWLAMHTLTRRGSLVRLDPRDVDLVRMTITYRHTKTGIDVTAPLVPACLTELQGWLAAPGPLLYDYSTPAGISQAFRRICGRLGIKDFHFHDLRHDLATRLVDANVDLLVIKELGGWKTMAMVARYAHAKDAVKREAMGKVFG